MSNLAMELCDAAVLHGGGTFDYTGQEVSPINGYVVGGAYPSLTMRLNGLVGPATIQVVDAWVANNRSSFYGSWVDEDGVCYIDAVDIVTDEFDAVVLGKERGEKAIWDGRNNREIDLATCYLGDGWLMDNDDLPCLEG